MGRRFSVAKTSARGTERLQGLLPRLENHLKAGALKSIVQPKAGLCGSRRGGGGINRGAVVVVCVCGSGPSANFSDQGSRRWHAQRAPAPGHRFKRNSPQLIKREHHDPRGTAYKSTGGGLGTFRCHLGANGASSGKTRANESTHDEKEQKLHEVNQLGEVHSLGRGFVRLLL